MDYITIKLFFRCIQTVSMVERVRAPVYVSMRARKWREEQK